MARTPEEREPAAGLSSDPRLPGPASYSLRDPQRPVPTSGVPVLASSGAVSGWSTAKRPIPAPFEKKIRSRHDGLRSHTGRQVQLEDGLDRKGPETMIRLRALLAVSTHDTRSRLRAGWAYGEYGKTTALMTWMTPLAAKTSGKMMVASRPRLSVSTPPLWARKSL